jgi:hypothetical protein
MPCFLYKAIPPAGSMAAHPTAKRQKRHATQLCHKKTFLTQPTREPRVTIYAISETKPLQGGKMQ